MVTVVVTIRMPEIQFWRPPSTLPNLMIEGSGRRRTARRTNLRLIEFIEFERTFCLLIAEAELRRS